MHKRPQTDLEIGIGSKADADLLMLMCTRQSLNLIKFENIILRVDYLIVSITLNIIKPQPFLEIFFKLIYHVSWTKCL